MEGKTIKRLNDLGVGHGKVEGPKIDPRTIVIRPNFNMRGDMTATNIRAHIEHLKVSILDNLNAGRGAIDKPLQVEWANLTPYLIDGECRLTAVLELWQSGHEIYVPVMQVSGDEADILAIALRANGGLPPTQLQFGERANRLIELGWSVDRVAGLAPPHLMSDRVRRMWVKQSLELQHAPAEVQDQVKHGVEGVAISPAAALHETRKGRTGAAERIKASAVAAKAAGKKELKREKTPGKATVAKRQATTALEVGDQLATLCITEHPDWDAIDKLARKYIRLRKHA